MPAPDRMNRRKSLVGAGVSFSVAASALLATPSTLAVCMFIIGFPIGCSVTWLSIVTRRRQVTARYAGLVLLLIGLILPASIGSRPLAGIVEVAALFTGLTLSNWYYCARTTT